MISDSYFERKAGLNRAIASNQALLDEIQKHCAKSKNQVATEYWLLKVKLEDMTDKMTKLPEDEKERSQVREIMLRMLELRKSHIVYDDTEAGAKYHTDTEKVDHL